MADGVAGRSAGPPALHRRQRRVAQRRRRGKVLAAQRIGQRQPRGRQRIARREVVQLVLRSRRGCVVLAVCRRLASGKWRANGRRWGLHVCVCVGGEV
eukprot:114286-Chlamydomonas_euryale.AAC.11